MAAGEYVSVASQADTEAADRGKERSELASNPDEERAELAGIYVRRGLTPELAQQVADQLTAHDALGAHLRDELGYTATSRAQPLQAAGASAASFALGAVAPLVLAASLPPERMQDALPAATVGLLALLGATAARLGGASWLRGALRVSLWGIGAMLGTALIGRLFDVRV
jgi:VIT1/CCC1 family predicted Fe2+/Mn2+ transporter